MGERLLYSALFGWFVARAVVPSFALVVSASMAITQVRPDPPLLFFHIELGRFDECGNVGKFRIRV
jgi:hypothetical protein